MQPIQVALFAGLLNMTIIASSEEAFPARVHAVKAAANQHDWGPMPVSLPSLIASSSKPIPEEPSEYDPREVKAYYDWRNDLFFREFDLGGTGRIDFMTARRTYKVWLNDFGNPVVLTMANPLFYWVDVDGNGAFDSNRGEMWSDPEEDGLNGNETHYDSPPLRSSGPPKNPTPPHRTL